MSSIANELIEDIISKRRDHLKSKIKRYPSDKFRASDIHECDFYMVSSILNWEKKSLHESDLQAIFDRGNTEENIVVKDLMELGFNFIHQQQPFELKTKNEEVYCRGHIDGKIIYKGEAIPCEIKSMNINTFNLLNSLDDFNKRPLHRKYLRQMQLYLYGNNKEEGIFILSDLQGHYKFFEIKLDYNEVEKIISRLEKLWENVKNKEFPESIEFNEKICDYCPYKHICPTTITHPGANLIDSTELEKLLEERASLKIYSDQYEEIDQKIKNQFKNLPGENFIGKDWLIKNTPYDRTTYDIPDNIKNNYKTKIQCSKISIIYLGNPEEQPHE